MTAVVLSRSEALSDGLKEELSAHASDYEASDIENDNDEMQEI